MKNFAIGRFLFLIVSFLPFFSSHQLDARGKVMECEHKVIQFEEWGFEVGINGMWERTELGRYVFFHAPFYDHAPILCGACITLEPVNPQMQLEDLVSDPDTFWGEIIDQQFITVGDVEMLWIQWRKDSFEYDSYYILRDGKRIYITYHIKGGSQYWHKIFDNYIHLFRFL